MTTQAQIETRALELFHTREENRSKRELRSFVPGKFEGIERQFCINAARQNIEAGLINEAKAQAVIASMADLTDDDLRDCIRRIENQQSASGYHIATRLADQDADSEELYLYRSELLRRTLANLDAVRAAAVLALVAEVA